MPDNVIPSNMDVLILGDCVVDLFYNAIRFPIEKNSLVVSRDFRISLGGACNTAVALRRMGLRVGVLDRFGNNDPFSNFLINKLKSMNILILGNKEEGFITISNNLVDEEKNHAFLGHIGTNANLNPEDLKEEVIERVRAVFMNGFNAISLGTIRETAIKALNLVIKHGKYLFFDLGPLIEPSSQLYSTILKLDYDRKYVFMNLSEAINLCRCDKDDITYFLKNFSGVFIVKLGDGGAVIIEHDKILNCPAFKPRRIINSIGAGDVFDAAFLAGILRGLNHKDSCSIANFLASIKLEYMCVEDIPSLGELRTRIESLGLGPLFSGLID